MLHSDSIAAMDFFTVPSWNFKPLYVFFIISHNAREIIHISVTEHPNMIWFQNQMRNVFPGDECIPNYLIHDNEPVFKHSKQFLMNLPILPIITAPFSPWQNGIAERFVRTIREDLTNHVIPLSVNHLQKLVIEYVKYYNNDRSHSFLDLDTPNGRNHPETSKCSPYGRKEGIRPAS
jgi:putative transposase